MSVISVNCLFEGHDPSLMVTVEVDRRGMPDEGNISLLKDLIKAKMSPSLDHVPASALQLWQVDFALNDNKLRNFACDGQPLLPVKRLKMFKNANKDNVHVIVQLPGMSQ
jgi:hypothetical protein